MSEIDGEAVGQELEELTQALGLTPKRQASQELTEENTREGAEKQVRALAEEEGCTVEEAALRALHRVSVHTFLLETTLKQLLAKIERRNLTLKDIPALRALTS